MMKKVMAIVLCFILLDNYCYANTNCGKGKLEIVNRSVTSKEGEGSVMLTPNGDMFTLIDTQRGTWGPYGVTMDSWSYNEETEQLFGFEENGIMPSLIIKCKRINKEN